MENMNRTSFALFVALLIHLLFLLLFVFIETFVTSEKKPKELKEERMKISLKELPKKTKEKDIVKEKIKRITKAPPMPKGDQLKKIIKKQIIKKRIIKKTPPIKKIPKEIKSIKPIKKKPIKKIIKEPIFKKEKIQKTPKTEKKVYDPLGWMREDRSEEDKNKKQIKKRYARNSSINQNIKKLYGDKFGKLTLGQQKYIIDNTEIMRRITQQVLTRVASVNLKENLNVNRTNVIEFYLHPNGDISDFKFLKQSGYFVLDHTTKETIEYAYSKYPRPTEKVLIRYNVMYNLAY